MAKSREDIFDPESVVLLNTKWESEISLTKVPRKDCAKCNLDNYLQGKRERDHKE